MLIRALILFFIFLIIYQFLSTHQVIEGLETTTQEAVYSNYDTKCKDPQGSALILSQQNAGNIEYLKQQITKVMGLDKTVQDLSGNVTTLNEQVAALVKQQAQAATQLAGNKPLETTGLASVK
jgi:uncharacterized protein involved in exopolysaccharide biosynthesis